MKILVLGCGEMGEAAVDDLYKYGNFKEIIIGTRSIEKAKKVMQKLSGKKLKLSPREIDIKNTEELEALMRGTDVVVNCIGPNYKYEVSIAQTAIRARVDLVDINDEYETTFEMLDLDENAKEAGITIVLGLGSSPGINNIFARAAADQLDEVDEVHTAWVMSAADPGGLALSYHLLYSLSGKALTYQDGKFVEVRSFVDGKEKMKFPEPVGEKVVYHVGHPEPITLSRSFKGAKIINDKATFHPSFLNDLILNLGKMVREAENPIKVGKSRIDAMDFAASYFHEKCKSLKGVPKEGALRVAVKGRKEKKTKKIVYSSSGLIAEGTGIAASIGAQMLAEGKIRCKGVSPPEECVDWREFLINIISRKIGQLDIKEEG
jgi:saccharopine dehydrogenase-like NADP-dependent oxidoreductase